MNSMTQRNMTACRLTGETCGEGTFKVYDSRNGDVWIVEARKVSEGRIMVMRQTAYKQGTTEQPSVDAYWEIFDAVTRLVGTPPEQKWDMSEPKT